MTVESLAVIDEGSTPVKVCELKVLGEVGSEGKQCNESAKVKLKKRREATKKRKNLREKVYIKVMRPTVLHLRE